MVVAHFHRTLAIVFYLVAIISVTTVFGVVTYLAFWQDVWEFLGYVDLGTCIVWLIYVPTCIFSIREVTKNPQAIWVENGVLHFHEVGPFGEISESSVPLDSIDGVTSGRPDFPETADGLGIFIDLKSGMSRKVPSFLIREKDAVVRARLREALAAEKAKA